MRNHILLILCISIFGNIRAQQSDFQNISFKKADSIAKLDFEVALENMPLLVYNLTNNLDTEVEKFRAIYMWVCLNIESDHGFSELTLRKRRKYKGDSISFAKWNKKAQKQTFKKLLNEQKTICTGYAYVLKELASMAGLTCKIVNGYSRIAASSIGKIDIPNHSWNVVLLNNKWYLADATLASGFYNVTKNTFIKSYNNGYFLGRPELFSSRHYPLNEKWLLLNENTSLKTFVDKPITYGETFKNDVIPVLPEKFKNEIFKGDTLTFKLKVFKTFVNKDFKLLIISGFHKEEVSIELEDYNDGILPISYQFNRSGNYDTHIMIDNEVVATYVVKVRKPEKRKA